MRPLRSFFLLLIFLACFTGLHYIIPLTSLFPSVYEYFPEYLVSSLLSNDNVVIEQPVNPAVIVSSSLPDTTGRTDSIAGTEIVLAADPLKLFIDSLRYSSGQIRIMYYGDSQIEGDRISSYLRHVLRQDHGGTGPGLFLPLMPVMYTKSIWLRSSSNWKKYNYLSYKTGEISHLNMAPLMALCRYLPEGVRSDIPEKASVKIRASKESDNASSEYDLLRIFYGNAEDIVKVCVNGDGKEIFSDTLKRGNGFYETRCRLGGAKEIVIEFTGRVSPDIYGISIESDTGIIVDNIPQRGSAGLEFTMVNRERLSESFGVLGPDLIILHYGLNIVRNVRDDYTYYQKGLARQLLRIKEISPSAAILVISLTDMAATDGDSIRSFRNIPFIIEAQKRATLDAGVAFWDSYSAMGGESSIIRWAEKKPPLAQKDYIHFTYSGADTLSGMLTDVLLAHQQPDSVSLASKIIATDSIITGRALILAPTEIPASKKSYALALLESVFSYDPDNPLIFSTAVFWLFFLFVLAGYSLVYKKLFLRNLYLFIVSIFFYYKSGGLFLSLLFFVALIDFTCGLLIHRSERRFMRGFFVLISIVSNLGILAYFKYTGFFIESINQLFGTDYRVYDFLASFSNSYFGTSFNISNIILPVGISFFTFQSLSYTFDVYRRKMEPVRNIIDFGFYVSFFPQLVAGPIVRASEFIPQIYNEFRLARREFSHALFLISKGLIKKVIISDFIATNFIDRVFDAPSIYSGFENLMAVYGYGLQIYCDFSGYTDIAIGLALILGFRLPINFNSPYKAASVADFWKRWHISLSRWLKDYLYIPLGGNRKGVFRTNINLIITMLLGGLWHGASLRFIIWGLLHGAGLVFNRLWSSVFGEKLQKNKIWRALAVFITFHFVTFCWIFFRATDMESVATMLGQIIDNFSPGSYIMVLEAYSSVLILIVAGYSIHFLPEAIKESYRGLFIRMPVVAQLFVIFIVAVLLFQMRTTDVMPFIYFRF